MITCKNEKFAFDWEEYNICCPDNSVRKIYFRKYINDEYAAEINFIYEDFNYEDNESDCYALLWKPRSSEI